MAQFDVYRNPSSQTRRAYPFLVDVQSPVISGLATRIVIPLGRLSDFRNESLEKLTPEMEYQGEKLLLLTPQIAAMPAKILREPIGSLSHLRDTIVAALDFAITGI